MKIGIPAEIKTREARVAITPDGVRELVSCGGQVHVQKGAGEGSSISDQQYSAAGATIVPTAEDAWSNDLVVKVKEPQPSEFGYLTKSLTLFTYLHLAAYPKVAKALMESHTTAFAYETVEDAEQRLPLLAPMSEIAGRMATQIGAHYLEALNGGSGVLLGGAPGVEPGKVVVIGGGNVGWNAARVAMGMGAQVTLVDRDLDRLRYIDQIHQGRLITLASNRGAIERSVSEADLVIGAVLVPGGKAPMVMTKQMVKGMKRGSVVVDVAVDQGGCFETTRETTHADPIYEVDGVIHYAVGNIPGAVPHTSTFALTNSTLSYIAQIVKHGPKGVLAKDEAFLSGINVAGGCVVNRQVADALEMQFVDPLSIDI